MACETRSATLMITSSRARFAEFRNQRSAVGGGQRCGSCGYARNDRGQYALCRLDSGGNRPSRTTCVHEEQQPLIAGRSRGEAALRLLIRQLVGRRRERG